MVIIISALAALTLYLCTTFYYLHKGTAPNKKTTVLLTGGGLAIALHGLAASALVFGGGEVNLSLWPVSVLILFVVNLLALTSSIKRPFYSLLLLLFPASALTLALALAFFDASPPHQPLSLTTGIHVVLSLLAYSLLTIAAVQSLLLAYQHYQLKHHSPGGFLRDMPPLQTMEQLLFQVIGSGFVLLTLSLISGFLFLDNIWVQHLAHKTFFSLIAWLVFAILLWGRHRLGWRGNTAIRWTLSGFSCLALAYWGSKFVLEIVLGL